jgi:hypothetical protein
MEINKLRSIIRESIKDAHLKEIETVAENAAMEARLAEYGKAIKMCEDKIEIAESLEEMKDLVDEGKINELKKKLKSLTKAKEKLEKAKDKKNNGKKVVTDEPTEDTVDEGSYYNEDMNLGEEDLTPEESEELRKKAEQNPSQALPEAFLKMQKLAGVITESQYNQKIKLLNEEIKLPQVGDEFSYPEEEDKIQITKVDNQYVYARSKTKDNKNYTIGLTSWEDKITKGKLLNEEITVGGTYTASMPTSSDGKERIDVKVKVLGKDRSDEDKFIVTPLEDKDYTNTASGQQNRFEKGKQYGVEAEFIK